MPLNLSGFELKRLNPLEHFKKPFDCGDKDLNEFWHDDILDSSRLLLTVSYVMETGDTTAAFFSLLNDKISSQDTKSHNSFRKKLKALFSDRKQFRSYPAVKMARLGVGDEFQGLGLGTSLMDYTKKLFVDSNRTGCRFITVDAYNNDRTLKFYRNNGFDYLTTHDADGSTRLMYFDLAPIARALGIDSSEIR